MAEEVAARVIISGVLTVGYAFAMSFILFRPLPKYG